MRTAGVPAAMGLQDTVDELFVFDVGETFVVNDHVETVGPVGIVVEMGSWYRWCCLPDARWSRQCRPGRRSLWRGSVSGARNRDSNPPSPSKASQRADRQRQLVGGIEPDSQKPKEGDESAGQERMRGMAYSLKSRRQKKSICNRHKKKRLPDEAARVHKSGHKMGVAGFEPATFRM